MGCGLDTDSTSEMRVYLHGNHIASYTDDGQLYINHQGWRTRTTKSRLNALIKFVLGEMSGIYQKNFEWFVKQTSNVNGMYDEYSFEDGWNLV